MEEEETEEFQELEKYHKATAAAESRALHAERLAWESQQAVLTLQSQFQQFFAYHAANATVPTPETLATTAGPSSPVVPAARKTVTSPQLPRNGKPTAVRKENLKETGMKTTTKHGHATDKKEDEIIDVEEVQNLEPEAAEADAETALL